jgi:hypothetical protein
VPPCLCRRSPKFPRNIIASIFTYTLKMEAIFTSETFVVTCKTTRRHKPAQYNPNFHRRENLRPHTASILMCQVEYPCHLRNTDQTSFTEELKDRDARFSLCNSHSWTSTGLIPAQAMSVLFVLFWTFPQRTVVWPVRLIMSLSQISFIYKTDKHQVCPSMIMLIN